MTPESFVTLLIVAWLGASPASPCGPSCACRVGAHACNARHGKPKTGIPRDRHSLFHNAAEAATPTGHGRKACWETPSNR